MVPARESSTPTLDDLDDLERLDRDHDVERVHGHAHLDGLEPWARERIERAVAPYRAVLSAADLDWMRGQLALAMEDDPETAAAARAAHGSNEASGTVPRRGGHGQR